ncbi:cyclin-K-like isoform X2 [Ruditapes philippinarum]|uniref:cyclin-K-like isoform X2 n=1 Tax=Ruditapes philippinarum TaxID=129788 RepID=UPI00295BA4BD|nr:cyclin-K-like isoform X2 [Ruditapes philippinarum]
MPCWYYEKKEIKNSPTYRDGIDSPTEARYRREGARFIVDAGTKLGLRYDTCATGVVYFHRFYMFHSFKDFPRYVSAACCLFLAGKVEETPKKCKDIIKISQQILNSKQFAQFGTDPKEEVMILERILLQTIKFDLQAEHPYAYLIKFAKLVKADKEKVQKLVQMAWTFINDSLCTTLCLQWEPEIIAISLMYLGTRLNKFEITEWQGKVAGTKQKWWESIVPDLTVELMEDVCHQVLDLYSPSNQASANPGESPPPPPPSQNPTRTPNSQGSDKKRSLQSTPSDPVTPGAQSAKSMKLEHGSQSRKSTPQKNIDKGRESAQLSRQPSQAQIVDQSQPHQKSSGPVAPSASNSSGGAGQEAYGTNPNNPQAPPTSYPSSQYQTGTTTDFSQYNPYVSSNQYQASFLSGEGVQSLQTLMGTQPSTFTQSGSQPQYAGYPPPQTAGAPSTSSQYSMPGAPQQYPPGYNPSQYPASAAVPGPPVAASQPPFQQQNVQQQTQQFQGTSYSQYPQYSNFQQQNQPSSQQQAGYDQYRGGGANFSGGSRGTQRHRTPQSSHRAQPPRGNPNITTVRITGR